LITKFEKQKEGYIININPNNLHIINELFSKYFRKIIFYYAIINIYHYNEGKHKKSLR
jgi:hypothetical protein